jgi:DNA repair protein RecO (recombination protein O)
MNRFTTQGIILARTNYAEADRILTFLTPDHGKVQAIAKGVRKQKSKLAGGIELFSISHLTLLVGRSDINTLMSTRLDKHYANIVKQLPRSDAAYEMIRLSNKATEEVPEAGYFNLLKHGFESLDDLKLEPAIVLLWFQLQLLKLAGHSPDLHSDVQGAKLSQGTYEFDVESMHFIHSPSGQGMYTANHIKFLRVGLAAAGPGVLLRVSGSDKLCQSLQPLVQAMLRTFIRA